LPFTEEIARALPMKALKGGDSDITQIVQPVEQWAGVEAKSGGQP